MPDTARSLQYNINVKADTANAESKLQNLVSNYGKLGSQADSVGSAFRKSFLTGIDSGNTFSSSLKSGVGGAFEYTTGKAGDFKNNVVSNIQNIGNAFAHPIDTIKSGLGNAIKSAQDKFTDMARSAENAADGTEDLGDASSDAQKDVKNVGDEAEHSGHKFETLGNIAKTAGAAIGIALGAAVGAVGAFGYSAVQTGMEFDSAMSQVSATMGMTTDDIANNVGGAGDTFDALRDKAKEMGASTNFSATQAAEGLNILAMSGYDATQSMDMIEDVLHLAAAGGMEMAESADYIAGSMKGFNDETKDSAYYADLMAKGATLANTSVAELGQAMSGGAATAAAYGQSADGMTLSLLRLAEQGMAGSAASTALNAAMKDLYTPSEQAAGALKELGVAIYDEQGNAREFNTVVNELDAALSGMSDEQANAYKSTIFQIQGLQAFNKMTVTSTEKQEEWAEALANASGEAANQYDTMTDNLQGDIDIWNSALDGFKIALSDELTPTIREFVQFGSDSLGKLTEAFEVGGIEGAMGALGEILSDGLDMVVQTLPGMVDAGMQLIGALGQGIIDNLPTILNAAMDIISSLGQGILDNLPMILTAAITIITTLATGLGEALPELIPAVIDTILTMVETLIENLPLIIDAGMSLLGGLIEGITTAIPMLVERLPEIIMSILNYFTENGPLILQQGMEMLMQLGMGIINAIPQLVSQLPAIITGIIDFITTNLPAIVEMGVNLIVQLAVGLVQAIPQLVASLPQIITAIVQGFAQVPEMMLDIGKNIVEGVWNGISQMGQWIMDKVSGFFGGIVDGVKGLLGIHSPSTVFAGIGDNMAAGVGVGFEQTMGSVAKDIEGAIPTDIDVPAPNVEDASYSVNPVVGEFNPPDVSMPVGMQSAPAVGEAPAAETVEQTSSSSFAPVINIMVSGNVDEETTENLSESLRNTVRELFDEFRQQELEQQSLKNAYAF
ncbi:MAG: phage tail tape measure protein [Lachnospiraceae bacterium]|nr:phage tail tape measure protein [Lachnospiraceae bacterium]